MKFWSVYGICAHPYYKLFFSRIIPLNSGYISVDLRLLDPSVVSYVNFVAKLMSFEEWCYEEAYGMFVEGIEKGIK